MNSLQVFEAIEQIAATSSKNEKQAIITDHIGQPLFKQVLIAALDPLISYGISKRPPSGSAGDGLFDAGTWATIDDLAARRLTGDNAILVVCGEMERLDPASSELFWRVIKKDLRAGFGAETVNKVAKGLIRAFPYMRCVLPAKAKFNSWDWERGAFSQQKADGMFANIDHDEAGVVRITTRQGNELPLEKFEHIELEVKRSLLRGTQTHGEILVTVNGSVLDRAANNGLLNHVIEGGDFSEDETPVFFAWDQIDLRAAQPKGDYKIAYRERFAGLTRQIGWNYGSLRMIPTEIVHSLEAAYAHCTSLQVDGKEGTVLKNGDGFWKDTSSGNPDVVKLKLEVDVELVTKEVINGEEGTKNEGRAGTVRMETRDGKLSVNVTVKNEKLRDAIDKDRAAFIDRVWTVRFNDITEPSESNPLHSLFLPRMAEDWYRIDKDVADSLEEVYAQKEAAVRGGLSA
jgi:DNA ligase 1